MKKLISILLVASMLLSFSVIAFAENETVKNGDVIFFGNYPQTLVTDVKLAKKLDKAPKKWVSYEHRYSDLVSGETDGVLEIITGVTTDNMQYADFSYEGVNYRGVNYVEPSYVSGTMHWPSEELYPEHEAFNTVFYFRYEPIAWIVVDSENKIVMSQKALDQKEFLKETYYNSENEYYYADNTMGTYANDYSVSDLRKWLNDDFVSLAFSHSQTNMIVANTYELDVFDFIIRDYYPNGNTVTDKIVIPASRDYTKYNVVPELSDYAKIQGHNDTISTRTVYDTIIDNGHHSQAIWPSNLEGQGMLNSESVANIVPMMKLSSLENNKEMPLFENGSKCNCICHKTEHENNFLIKFISKFIFEIWSVFSIKQYCGCNLRHY